MVAGKREGRKDGELKSVLNNNVFLSPQSLSLDDLRRIIL